MRNNLLIPNRYKVIGWMTFLIFTALGLAFEYLEFRIPSFQIYFPKDDGIFDGYNLTNELAIIGMVISLLTIAFAKEKNEDENISFLRLKSWQWSVLASYAILILLTLLVYGLNFYGALVYNMFTVLLVFIVKFNWSLYQFKKEGLQDEK